MYKNAPADTKKVTELDDNGNFSTRSIK